MQLYDCSSTYKWKSNQFQRTSMKLYEKYSNVAQYGSKSMNTIRKHHDFLVRASDSDLHFREA